MARPRTGSSSGVRRKNNENSGNNGLKRTQSVTSTAASPPSAASLTRSRSSRSRTSLTEKCSSEQISRFKANATRAGRRMEVGERGLQRSFRRTISDPQLSHPFLQHRSECVISHDKAYASTKPHPPREEDRNPAYHKYGKGAHEDERAAIPAGVESIRMTKIESKNLHDHATVQRPFFAPPLQTDPITHQDSENLWHEWANRDDHHGALRGAAGCRTDRLTYFAECNLTTEPHLALSPFSCRLKKCDPVSHDCSVGHRPEEHAQAAGLGPNFGGGPNRLNRSDWNPTLLWHTTKTPSTRSKEEIQTLKKAREVIAPGEVLYFVAGGEDLLPPATKEFKADMHSDLTRNINEKKQLSPFDRYRPNKLSNPCLLESEDMYHALCGKDEGRRRFEIDRTGRNIEDEETAYTSSWVAHEIAKGRNGQERAKSLEPPAQSSREEAAGGSMTARQPRASGEPTTSGPPLRWPNHMTCYGNDDERSRSATPQPFRQNNGLCDFAGLNGLGIWRAHNSVARNSSSNRTKTPERSAAERTKSPSRAPATSTPGRTIRSPHGFSASAERDAASAPPLDSARAKGGASSDNFNATQPRAALDRTREKGAEFPKTPQFKAKTFEASNGGSKVKGVWSRPMDTMRLGSSGVEVFSL